MPDRAPALACRLFAVSVVRSLEVILEILVHIMFWTDAQKRMRQRCAASSTQSDLGASGDGEVLFQLFLGIVRQ